MTSRETLLAQLVLHAYQYNAEAPFLLASGQHSDEYLDCRLALSRPEALQALGALIQGILLPGVVALGGLTMGADPIAIGTSLASVASRHPVRWFSVRKQAKQHGQKRLIEGQVEPGDRVAVVDDVVTTGGSTLQALRACREFGLDVVQVVVLVDRQQADGLANIQGEAGPHVPTARIFTKDEIRNAWLAAQMPA